MPAPIMQVISKTLTGGHIGVIGGTKIRTDFVYPPIPVRDMDWQAVRDDDEPNDDGYMRHVGHGRTEQAAIDDLLESLEAWDVEV